MLNQETINLISCELCQKELVEPILLPCLNSVCNHHITTSDSFYKCEICKRFHKVPEQGFVKDRRAEKLISIKNSFKNEIKSDDYIKIDQINFGEVNRNARDNCKKLEFFLKQGSELVLNSFNFINEFFDKIIKEVDYHKDETISLVIENHQRIVDSIIYEKNKCLENRINIKNLKNEFENTNEKLEKWFNELKVPDFDNKEKWEGISNEATVILDEVKNYNKKVQNNLLLNNIYEFKPIKHGNNFGDFCVELIEKEKTSSKNNEPERYETYLSETTLPSFNYEEEEEWGSVSPVYSPKFGYN